MKEPSRSLTEPVKTGFHYTPFEERPGGSRRPKPVIENEEAEEDTDSPGHCGDGVGLANMTAKQLNAWHQELRTAIPKLTFNEIRRHRLPLHISLCFELEEEGLLNSAAYIKDLIQFNNEMREAAGPGTIIWLRPKLIDNRAFLQKLAEGLARAEKAEMADNIIEQCRSFLRLAVFFMSEKNCWWWLAKQLFTKCVDCVVPSKDELKKIETIVRYIYGMFLLRQLNDVDGALFQLQLARENSEGTTWCASRELRQPQLSVFVETCRHLYKALLLQAISVRSTDPAQSVRLCKEAYKRAVDADMPEAKAEALYEKGLSYQEDDQPTKALKTFVEHLQICKFLKNSQWMCNSYLEIAFCYKSLSDITQTMAHLIKFKELAERENLIQRLAEAFRYLGEFQLNLGNTEDARSSFAVSFSLYFKLQLKLEIEEVRALACITEGQQLLPLFAQLIKDSSVNGPSTVALLRWKDIRLPFWGDEGCASQFSSSIEEESRETIPHLQSGENIEGEDRENTENNEDGVSITTDVVSIVDTDAVILAAPEEEITQIEPDADDA